MRPTKDIAIVGMSLRFPGANDVNGFWKNIVTGTESITNFSDEELRAAGLDESIINGQDYVKSAGIIKDVDQFDANFFGYSQKDAELADPQSRIFLECAWEALEDSGYVPETFDGKIGVYGSAYASNYLLKNLPRHVAESAKKENEFYTLYQCVNDYLATNTAYKLNLKGPSISIQTWCTSTIVATHLACKSLREKECDMALAGGVQIRLPQEGYFVQDGYSPDGHCRSFDKNSNGMVAGSGAGILVLKRLEDAVKHRDHIYAVIKGTSINNDGAGNQKLSYHGITSQGIYAAAMDAIQDAEINPSTIQYMEGHGGATELGDRIEFSALTKAYTRNQEKYCAIGSVRPNIGHLGNASGAAALIKTALALNKKIIPPSINFTALSSFNDKKHNPFYVNTISKNWDNDLPRRAAVNSYGVGGTNTHVILEEAPERTNTHTFRSPQLLTVSAKTPTALDAITKNLINYLLNNPTSNLADIAYTLNIGRKNFAFKRATLITQPKNAVVELQKMLAIAPTENLGDVPPVAFMFPGHGDQYDRMAFELYQTEPAFKKHLDVCAKLFHTISGIDFLNVLYPSVNSEPRLYASDDIRITHPALFSIEYAMSQMLIELGIQPKAMIGYSLGEIVAACLAGVFTLEEALTLIADQAALVMELAPGGMLAVPLSEKELKPYLGSQLSIAAINGPSICIVSGPQTLLDDLQQQIRKLRWECMPLQSSYAFHSGMVDPIVDKLAEKISKIKFKAPSIPFISTVTGKWITTEEAIDPSFWAKKIRQTVLFDEGIQKLLEKQEYILLEVGPRQTLSSLTKAHPKKSKNQTVLSMQYVIPGQQSEKFSVLDTVKELWKKGVPINWKNFYQYEERNRLPLPTYPFERQRYWIEPQKGAPLENAFSKSLQKREDLSEWFYVPRWKHATPHDLSFVSENLTSHKFVWMVFEDTCHLSTGIIKKLHHFDQKVIRINAGKEFAQVSAYEYRINPALASDYGKLIESLKETNLIPEKIIHVWNVSANEKSNLSLEDLRLLQESGFYSLLFLTQAFGEKLPSNKLTITVVSNHTSKVTGEEILFPEKATVLGLIKVIPIEYRIIKCSSIDVVLPNNSPWDEDLLDNLLYECLHEPSKQPIAYRGAYRFEQLIEQLPIHKKQKPTRLKKDATYLITGGLGGMGLVLAEHIVRTVKSVNLALLNRSVFPSKNEWDLWLQGHDNNDPISRKILKIRELEGLGATVLVFCGDVADMESMKKSIAVIKARFGSMNGVIHLAGISGGGLAYGQGVIQYRTKEEVEKVFDSKVYGTALLNKLFDPGELDFMILGSSNSSAIGFYGQADYSGANAYLDAYAHRHNSKSNPVLAINWDVWSEAGMALSTSIAKEERVIDDQALQNGILNTEGIEIFDRLLQVNFPQVIISTRNFHQIVEGNNEIIDAQPLASVKSNTRNFSKAYVAPTTKIEKEISKMWSALFGLESVGVDDNFLLDLGGHSLLAVRFLNRLHVTYPSIKVSLRELFKNPTTAQLAKHIEGDIAKGSGVFRYGREEILAMRRQDSILIIEKYFTDIITEALESTQEELPQDGSLSGIDVENLVKDISWYVKKDFNLMLFSHEIQRCSSVLSLTELLLLELEKHVKHNNPKSSTSLTDVKWVIPKNVSAQPKNLTQKNKQIAFIFSSPRSGSTLLRLMLAGHSKLFSPPELGLLIYDDLKDWYQHFVNAYSVSEMVRSGVINTFMELMNVQYDQAKLHVNKLVEDNVQTHKVYNLIQQLAGSRMLVDKAPSYAYDKKILSRAENIFEEPKYIYLYRHPYSVIESFARERFHKIHPDEKEEYDPHQLGEYVWNLTNSNILEFLDSIDKERYHFIRYEEMVTNPLRVMSDLCAFLEIPFEDAVLHPYHGNRMITGSGDPNIFMHDKIEQHLGDKWKQIRLPITLNAQARVLASRLNYTLPNEFESLSNQTKKEELNQQLSSLGELSPVEIDALLKSMLQ
jgi:phthiocerol/phenolphthiocerol synthesis type-I polyketide synthase E